MVCLLNDQISGLERLVNLVDQTMLKDCTTGGSESEAWVDEQVSLRAFRTTRQEKARALSNATPVSERAFLLLPVRLMHTVFICCCVCDVFDREALVVGSESSQLHRRLDHEMQPGYLHQQIHRAAAIWQQQQHERWRWWHDGTLAGHSK
jgi:hypothetical protein